MHINQVQVSAFYKFVSLSEERVASIKRALEEVAQSRGIKGLVVLGIEGINATVAGVPEAMLEFKAHVRELLAAPELEFKDSFARKVPFARFKVDCRAEIITTKDPSISSEESIGTHLTPEEWHQMLATDPDVIVVDTRNDYEIEIGVFEGAVDPKIKKFSDFQNFVKSGALPRDKKLLMYCTGGIRCEKAVPEVKRLGYDNVYQLEGGILKYLEAYPDGYFKGECFVFDHRVAVDKNLEPSKTYRLCPHCGNPGRERISCEECGADATICSHCAGVDGRRSCSKNCAYHVRRKRGRVGAGEAFAPR